MGWRGGAGEGWVSVGFAWRAFSQGRLRAGAGEGCLLCCDVARDIFKTSILEMLISCKFYFCPSLMGACFIFTQRGLRRKMDTDTTNMESRRSIEIEQ